MIIEENFLTSKELETVQEDIINNQLRIRVVPWKGVDSPRPYRRRGFVSGVLIDIKKSIEVLNTLGIMSFLSQLFRMSHLLKKSP